MRQVSLSRHALAGTVANWLDAPGFPEQLSVALENEAGFGESSTGAVIGSVIDWTTNPDQGYFGAMARLDELVLNIPSREDLMRFFEAGSPEEVRNLSKDQKRRLATNYLWVFADRVGDTRIEWE